MSNAQNVGTQVEKGAKMESETAGLDLDAIRARAAAATPGPWYLLTSETEVASEHGENGPTVVVDTQFFYGEVTDRQRADATFIANARLDVPKLCDRVQAAEWDRVYWKQRYEELAALHEQVIAERDALRAAGEGRG